MYVTDPVWLLILWEHFFTIDKNNKQYELNVKLTDVDFSKSLEDHISGRYKELKTSLEKSVWDYLKLI